MYTHQTTQSSGTEDLPLPGQGPVLKLSDMASQEPSATSPGLSMDGTVPDPPTQGISRVADKWEVVYSSSETTPDFLRELADEKDVEHWSTSS